jgi:RHS repeat-associated protein
MKKLIPALLLLLSTLLLPQPSTVCAQGLAAFSEPSQTKEMARAGENPVTPNRVVPQVEAPQTVLAFPANPSPQDFFRARVFEEPLVPIGGEPSRAENAALATALLRYARRAGPDDFSSLTSFLREHPGSSWCAALLTDLGIEYYNTAHYSLALDAWARAWPLSKDAADPKGKAIADRAVGELAYMYARLGRMTELEALLKSIEGRVFVGAATERISGARGGLSEMKSRPEISFRCGPLALLRILLSLDPQPAGIETILDSASTTDGFSLPQVARLSQQVGLDYQMAFRERGAAFVVPSVVHWKVGHYAAMTRREDGLYLLEDSTFRNDAWVTKAALEEECSGYFLIPPGDVPEGWRAVASTEGDAIWGKGLVSGPDPGGGGGGDDEGGCPGMAVSSVDLLFVSLNLTDEPVGYSPPVGPPVRFRVSYNQRDPFQPANFTYSNFGPKWTFDWLAYIKDSPTNVLADVEYYRSGGFARFFTGLDRLTKTYALQRLDRTKLTRTSSTSYEMLAADGSRRIFSQSDGSVGSTRKVFLTQIIDPYGNATSLTYDAQLRIAAVTDAIGQVTTLTYGNPNDLYKITRVTDPFGRFATFEYDAANRLTRITDVIGLTSEFAYEGAGDFVNALITPYGTNTFIKGESGTTRWLETHYPDGNRERVEFNQGVPIPGSDPVASVPSGILTQNLALFGRNTFYWSKTACALGYGDYTKAKIFHWLHTAGDGTFATRVVESEKEPLEGRVWYNYPGQASAYHVGTINKPTRVGRVLDDGSTQLYSYEYNGFGNLTNEVDPVGRTFSYLYAANGIDLLETRQTRAGSNELLSQTTYNSQHLPLTEIDAAGQRTSYTYNARGQILTETDPRGSTATHRYDTNGYRSSVDGPLPGPGDTTTWTYDSYGRVRTKTDESGYTLAFDYDAMDRLTRITFPDGTYQESTYTRLDLTESRDRAGRVTSLEYNAARQLTRSTDPLNRVTQFQWCNCGGLKSLTDPIGRTTTWRNDVQGRVTAKVYPDGSEIGYVYEDTTSRLRERIDEKLQVAQYSYNRDDTVSAILYPYATIATPPVYFLYDQAYERPTSMADGTGTTHFDYVRITSPPSLGAGSLASEDGPAPYDTITYRYDELGRRVSTAIHGVANVTAFDAAGRVTGVTNALGIFHYTYTDSSPRPAVQTFPNGQTIHLRYAGNIQDQHLQSITNAFGNTLISAFHYTYDGPAGRIASWAQQSGLQIPTIHGYVYDDDDQLLAASVSQAGVTNRSFSYSYDPAANRLSETIDGNTNAYGYNALNQLTTTTGAGTAATNEWDAEDRLVAVNTGAQRTEFEYDGLGRRVGIRQWVNGAEVSNRRFVWCDNTICEERDANGVVSKRFFGHGVKLEAGPAAGSYFYTRAHLGSICEMTDTNGNVRARYAYDPFGRRTRVAGDLEADYGFAGMFVSSETGLSLTQYRAYDPELGRWLSRDPLEDAEMEEGPNLYAYVRNNVVNLIDPQGLCCEPEKKQVEDYESAYQRCKDRENAHGFDHECDWWWQPSIKALSEELAKCQRKPCTPPKKEPKKPGKKKPGKPPGQKKPKKACKM